jgi:ssDNA-binding Zn-finger/Zn-ribbon topoisomerase 1
MPSRHPLRYRRCPNCQEVRQASEFRRATGPTSVVGQLQRRRCPACGHVAPLMTFTIAEGPGEPSEHEPGRTNE